MVGERSERDKVAAARRHELFRSDYPDISSATIPMRNRNAVSLRFPGEGNSAQGQSVPKVRPKGVADGNDVNIRLLFQLR